MKINTMIKKQKELSVAVHEAISKIADEKVNNNTKNQSYEDFVKTANELSNKNHRLCKALMQIEETIKELELI